MKKLLYTFTLIIAIIAILCISVSAANIETTYTDAKGIEWKASIDVINCEATITGANLTEMTSSFDIPESIPFTLSEETGEANYPVVAIGDNAFSKNEIKNLVFGKLTLPKSLRTIGSSAFSQTRIYSDVVIPDSVTVIKNDAFRDCRGLLSITLPAGVTSIASNTFNGCYSLVAVYAPSNLVTIDNYAFKNCPGLYEIPIGAGTTKIGSEAFYGCKALYVTCQNLHYVENEDGTTTFDKESYDNCTEHYGVLDLTTIESLSSKCFNDCINIEKVKFSSYEFDLGFFNGCSSLKSYEVIGENKKYATVDDVLFSSDMKTLYRYPAPKKGNKYVVPASVTTIEANAFLNASGLRSIVIGDNVTAIKDKAFSGTSIETFYFPNNISSLGSNVLDNCDELIWVVIGNGVTSANNLVANCDSITKVIAKNNNFSTNNVGKSGVCVKAKDITCLDHYYGYIGVPATCTESGINTCLVCEYSVYAKPLGHFGSIIKEHELTCTSPAYLEINCTRCGDEHAIQIIKEATGHVTSTSSFINQANGPQLTVATCSVCNQTVIKDYSANIFKIGDVNNDKLINESDVTYLGKYLGGISLYVNSLACDLNGDKVIDIYDLILLKRFVSGLDKEIANTNTSCDNHIRLGLIERAPDCVNNGITLSYCLDCGALVDSIIIEKLGHTFEEDKSSIISSTCENEGMRSDYCSVCNKYIHTVLPKLPHTENWWTIPDDRGHEYNQCETCSLFESREVDYSEYDELVNLLSPHYTSYYTETAVSLLSLYLENYKKALTQEQVNTNVENFKEVISKIEYKIIDVPVVYISTHNPNVNFTKGMEYVGAEIVIAYRDENGNYVNYVERDGETRVRGNSTADQGKKPYNIKFSTNVDFFGMGEDNKYCLLANALDTTMLRNALTMHINAKLGLDYACKYKFVDVYCNGSYKGSYLMTTAVEIEEDRINIDEETDILLEIEATFDEGAEYLYTNDYSSQFSIRALIENTTELNAEGYRNLFSTLYQLEYAIISGDWNEIQKYMDVDSMARYYILHEYMKDLDFTWDSTRFYIEDGKLHGGPAWDFDFAVGNIGGTGGTDNSRDSYRNVNGHGNGEEDDTTTGTWANAAWIGIPNENWISNPGTEREKWTGSASHHTWFTFLYYYSPEFMDLVSQLIWELRDDMSLMYEDAVDDYNNVTTNAIDSLLNEPGVYDSIKRNYIGVADGGAGHNVAETRSYLTFKSYDDAIKHLREYLSGRHSWMLKFYCNDKLSQAAVNEVIMNEKYNELYESTTVSVEKTGISSYSITININVPTITYDTQTHHNKLYEEIVKHISIRDVLLTINYCINSTPYTTYVQGIQQLG